MTNLNSYRFVTFACLAACVPVAVAWLLFDAGQTGQRDATRYTTALADTPSAPPKSAAISNRPGELASRDEPRPTDSEYTRARADSTSPFAYPTTNTPNAEFSNPANDPQSFPFQSGAYFSQVQRPAEPARRTNGDFRLVGADLPPPSGPVNVPLNDPTLADKVHITGQRDRISLKVREAPMGAVLALLAEQHGLNMVTAEEVNQTISLTLTNVTLEQALDAITLVNGYTWVRQQDVILVTTLGKEKSSPILQGQQVRVFCLNYVLANDVDKVVKGLLSPVGLSFINQTSPTDQRKTSEQVVVQDLPVYVQRIASYIQQVDQPPRQVLVEARVLQVNLKGDYAHGVNFQAMFNVAGAPITLGTMGFVDPASTPASFIRINGTDLNALIKCIETTAETKTLATPKVAVLNGQESRIQIGSKLGYKTLQNTQTATLENVQFLDTGVILKVVPNITDDGQILLQVNPQVSDGQIDPETGLPNSNTTEVETKVLLADGEALIIGGLIKDTDQENISKIPYLGDIKHLGYLFQKRSVSRQRTEIIIALLPRIISCAPGTRQQDCVETARAFTPLLQSDLNQVERRQWEPGVPRFWPDHSQPFAYGHEEPAPWPNSNAQAMPEPIAPGTQPTPLPPVTNP